MNKDSHSKIQPFHIVGIGASAGGLEAVQALFDNMPAHCNMAFVIIQHFPADYKSAMPELLRKHTEMDIYMIEDGMRIKPDCIYLSPAAADVAIIQDTFQLIPVPEEAAGSSEAKHTIDFFFRSLAEDKGERAICVILSGAGTDGTSGLEEIRNNGGMAMVQDVKQARYDGMPGSAINAGLADFILPVEEMPHKLIRYAKYHLPEKDEDAAGTDERFRNYMQKIFVLIRSGTGHDFSCYKKDLLYKKTRKRMAAHRIDHIEDYYQYLRKNPGETDKLYKDMLIMVTGFFRDPDAFEALRTKVLADILESKPPNTPVRIWVPGCATGEEAYSIAIMLAEIMEKSERLFKVTIFATDSNAGAIESARKGIYPAGIEENVPPPLLERYFTKKRKSYKVKTQIREMAVFSGHNIIKDPPFSRLDLISCRNVLIYMESELKRKIFPLFHHILNSNGFLFLGHSEMICEFTDLFSSVDTKWKIYRRKEVSPERFSQYSVMPFYEKVAVPWGKKAGGMLDGLNVRKLAEKELLEIYSPTCAIINKKNEVIYLHGNTDPYLSLSAGEVSLEILNMIHGNLYHKLAQLLEKAARDKEPVVAEGLQVEYDDDVLTIDLMVRPFRNVAAQQGLMMVIFQEKQTLKKQTDKRKSVYREKEADQQIASLEQELQYTKEYLHTTIEELQTSNEELQSANEELFTINAELSNKVSELGRVNDDLNNLLASTEIGTIFLNTKLCVMRFTPSITKLFNLKDADIGRPVSDITSGIVYDNLFEDIEEVLSTLNLKVAEINSRDGRCYSMRILPYRTVENIIDGVVLTFVDITQLKQTEAQVLKLSSAVEQGPNIVIITDRNGVIEYVNPKFTAVTGYTPEEAVGKTPYFLKSGKTPREQYTKLWSTITSGIEWRGEFQNRKKNGDLYWASESISPIKDRKGNITNFIAIQEDITERRNAGRRLNAEHAVTRTLAESATLEEASPKIISSICEALGWDLGGIWTIDQHADVLRCIKIWHAPDLIVPEFRERTREITFPSGIGLPGRIWKSGRPAWIKDVVHDTNFPRHKIADREGLHGAFGFPVLSGNEILGVIEFFSRHIQKPDSELLNMISSIGSQIGFFIRRKQAEERLKESEELHRLVLTNISDTVLITGNEGEITYICPNIDIIFGYSVAEVRDFANIRKLLGGKLFERSKLEKEGEIRHIERKITDKGGRTHFLLINVKSVSIGEGTTLYSCRDITDLTDIKILDKN